MNRRGVFWGQRILTRLKGFDKNLIAVRVQSGAHGKPADESVMDCARIGHVTRSATFGQPHLYPRLHTGARISP